MGSVDDRFSSAVAERLLSTLELLDRRWFKSQTETKIVAFDFIEG